jgi:hypothetical protein
MFERFTQRSRRVIVLAQEEARLLKHNYIGTEHLLLGLLADAEGGAARTLESVGVTLDGARREVRAIIGEGKEPATGHIPFTQRAKKVLELALREALTQRSQSIGSVHLLLGLISEGHGVGAQVIERLGAPLPTVKERAAEFAGDEPDPDPNAPFAIPEAAAASWRGTRLRLEGVSAVLESLAKIERRLSRIERHLGIAPDPADPDTPTPAPTPAHPAEAAPGEAAPAEAAPGEAAPAEAAPAEAAAAAPAEPVTAEAAEPAPGEAAPAEAAEAAHPIAPAASDPSVAPTHADDPSDEPYQP